jgi:hypothetical protein
VNRNVGKYRALATANQLEFIPLVFERLVTFKTEHPHFSTNRRVRTKGAPQRPNAYKDGGVNAGQLLDVVEVSAVFIARSMR